MRRCDDHLNLPSTRRYGFWGDHRLIAVDFDGRAWEPQTITAINDDDAVAKAKNFLKNATSSSGMGSVWLCAFERVR
jgi:hypothetical protein